jgi:VWFA-related protein
MFVRRSFLNRCMLTCPWPWRLVVIVPLCLYAAQSQSQQNKQAQKSPDQDEVVRVNSHLVNFDVTVRDKKGKSIADLKAEDFTVFENGVQQKVEFFDPPLAGVDEKDQPNVTIQQRSLISNGVPRNIISLVLDGQTTDQTNLKQVREGTIKYIRERIANTDTVALFAITGGLQLLQPFTQDKAKLISAVENNYTSTASSKNFEQRDIAENIAKQREAAGAPIGAITTAAGGSAAAQVVIAERVLQQFIKLRSQLSIQQSRPILAALAAICEGLRAIPGKKTLVLFSQGFVAPEVLDWQVQSTIDIANRANVAIYVIDSSGLRGGTPQSGSLVPASPLGGISGATSQESRIRAQGGETVFDNTRQEGLNREQDLLYRISGDTGGQFIKNTNDIARGLERIDQEIRSRYTLAYHSTDPNFDGSFRKVKIEVRRSEARLISRSGYYAIAPDDIVPLSPEDKKLLANFATGEANPAFPLFVELSSFRSQEGHYIVPLSIEIPPSAVEFDRKADKQQMQLDVLCVIRAAQDKILSRLGGSFSVALTREQYQSILDNNIFYRQDAELAPGTYSIDLIVRDRLSGKIAARREQLVLPVADAEFSATAVVLSRHAEPAKRQLAADRMTGAGDVFSEAGVQIRPSPSREFRLTDNLIIFFKLYNSAKAADTGKPLVRVTVTLINNSKVAIKPIDYDVTETLPEPVPHLTFAKYIRLAGLPAGKYVAMIEARDMVTGKLVKQQASFVIAR